MEIDLSSPCILWMGPVNGDGYGLRRVSGRTRSAHRSIYEESKGEIPQGFEIDHLCRIRNCVNPLHLEAVTKAENIRRSHAYRSTPIGSQAANVRRRLSPGCMRGHPFTEENTIWKKDGTRTCRICRSASNATWYRLRKS